MTIGTLPCRSGSIGLTERERRRRQQSNLRTLSSCSVEGESWRFFDLYDLLLVTFEDLPLRGRGDETGLKCGAMTEAEVFEKDDVVEEERRVHRGLKLCDTSLNQLLMSVSYRALCLYVPRTDRRRSESMFAVMYALSRFLLLLPFEQTIVGGGGGEYEEEKRDKWDAEEG